MLTSILRRWFLSFLLSSTLLVSVPAQAQGWREVFNWLSGQSSMSEQSQSIEGGDEDIADGGALYVLLALAIAHGFFQAGGCD